MFAILSCSSAFGQGETPGKAVEKQKPDRSAELQLKSVFESMGKIRTARVLIDRSTRSGKFEPFYFDGVTEFSFEQPNKFNVYMTEMWGDGFRAVSDGKTAMIDRLDGISPIQLVNAALDLPSNDASLAPKGSASSPLFYLLMGAKGFDKVVKKDGFIKRVASIGLIGGIEFSSEGFGAVKVYFSENDPKRLVRRIEFDNREAFGQMAADDPEDFGDSIADFMVRHEIRYLEIGAPHSKGTFVIRAPNGVDTDDHRSKKGKSPK